MDGVLYNVRTVEGVFRDFEGRRAGMIRALTTDVHEFTRLCNPEKKNLCLYGHPNEHWEVTLPIHEVPHVLPEPVLGINFARNGMIEKDWLSLVAVHCDAWLLSVAFYFGGKFGFDKADRNRLFNMVNDLPTIFEVVAEFSENQSRTKSSLSNNSSNGSNSNSKGTESQVKFVKEEPEEEEPEEEEEEEEEDEDEDEDEEEDEDEDEEEDETEIECGVCREGHATGEFWIGCDNCAGWFHGKCVKITPANVEHIKQYKCPSCNKKMLVALN